MVIAATPALQLERNLVVNGDAEANVGAANAQQIVKPKGWTTTGQFTAVQYGSPGGFPDAKSPGPDKRGKNDFEGGNAAVSTATQTISLAPSAALIDAGGVRYTFSAYLGGFADQDDNAKVTLTFHDKTGASLDSATIGPILAAQRNKTTGLIAQSLGGDVPKGAVSADVTVTLTRVSGQYNDGSADNISLVLHQ
jgi:hypothetical protein